MGVVSVFQQPLLSYSYQPKVKEIPQVPSSRSSLLIQGPPIRLSTAPVEFTIVEVKLMAHAQGITTHQHLNDCSIRAGSKES